MNQPTPELHEVTGIILCGGESSRMGSPKALLCYHQLPQYRIAEDLLRNYCLEILISCKKSQADLFKTSSKLLFDAIEYENSGPIAAILTALKTITGKPLLLLGCDYPALTRDDIQLLIQTYNTANKSVCYAKGPAEMEEPFLAIYHPADLQQLVRYYEAGNTSLSRFLHQMAAVKIVPENLLHIKSYDTPDEFKGWNNFTKDE